MIAFTLTLVCGHSTPTRYGPKLPPYLDPSETAWSLAWCGDCQTQRKVTDVRLIDGRGAGNGADT